MHNAFNGVPGSLCVISLGGNVPGPWGAPAATLRRALSTLEQNQVIIVARSQIYRTRAHSGSGLLPEFYNAVALVRTNHSIGSLLRLFKSIERRAGRILRPRWSARPLDLDIIDYAGRILKWPALNRLGGPIVLPHPLMHRRGFVLVPLAEIAPWWRHPVLGISARNLLRHNPALRRGIGPVDSPGLSWQ